MCFLRIRAFSKEPYLEEAKVQSMCHSRDTIRYTITCYILIYIRCLFYAFVICSCREVTTFYTLAFFTNTFVIMLLILLLLLLLLLLLSVFDRQHRWNHQWFCLLRQMYLRMFLLSLCLSVCPSFCHSCTMLKLLDGMRCHLAGTPVWSQSQ